MARAPSRVAAKSKPVAQLPPFPVEGLRMAVPQTMVLEHLEPEVARAFDSVLSALRKAGARIVDIFTLICVHPHQPTDPLFGVFEWTVSVGTCPDSAAVNTHK